MRLAVVASHLCLTVRSPESLADAYRFQAAVDLTFRDEYSAIVELYEPFADGVAVLEEFSMSQSGDDAFFASADLDARALSMSDEVARLDRDASRLLNAANVVPSSYRGLRRLRVHAMRAECLAVLNGFE